MSLALKPASSPLKGRVCVPGDKSISHRSLMLGALCEGELKVRNLANGQDVKSTRRVLEALGADIRDQGADVLVRGKGLENPFRAPSGALDCGNSGTTMRLMMGMLSGQPFESTLFGDASLSKRPMGRVADPLRQMGAEITLSEGGRAPVKVKGRRPLKALRYRLPVASAQVKSAVLLAGLFADGETEVEDPFRSRDHSERMLGWLGGDAVLRRRGDSALVRPGALRSGRALTVPGDPSSAAFFLAAAAIVPGSSVTVSRVSANSGRLGFVEALREMGARVSVADGGQNGGEPVGDLSAEHGPLRSLRLAADRIPALVDEIPLLAVVCSQASGLSRLEGLGELRHKESDRLEGTAAALRALGCEARVDGDALEIRGPARLRGGLVETLLDHRLAMAFAVAALRAEEEVRLSDSECVAISWPSFFRDLDGLRSPGR